MIEYQHAIRAVARDDEAAETAIDGMDRSKEWLDVEAGAFATIPRAASLIGQCAHESMGFSRIVESLWYSAGRLVQVWPSRFPSESAAEPFAGNPEALANRVYGGRMGNVDPGDGYRYRGRGWIQLTGRENYQTFGALIGVDLEADPGLASDPKTAWMIAGAYMANRSRSGSTVFEWADRGNIEQVTRAINGGTHGLADRRRRTELAERALNAEAST